MTFYNDLAGLCIMKKMKTLKTLILEDDLKTLAALMNSLHQLEERLINQNQDLAVTVFSNYTQVEDYLNKTNDVFDVILLDRDCKKGGSFHVLDLDKFGVDKIIGISSIPDYNVELKEKGVTRIVDKNYNDLETFALKVTNLVEEIIRS